jgi:RNA polymerase sigma-70 factor, ECF subfamily
MLTVSGFPGYKQEPLRLRRLSLMDERVVKWPESTVSARSKPSVSRLPPVDLSKESDIELMARLRDGQQEALSPLFDRYHRLVLSIAAKIVRDRTEAEDLMQEVFFAVYRFVDRFDPDRGTAKSWIVQFAYYKSLNRRRYLVLRGAFEDCQIRAFDPDGESHVPSPQNEEFFNEDMLAVVQQGLSELTPRQREVVQLACFEGLLFKEIADRTKESLNNVRHHYYRGIDKLREFVKRKSQLEEKQQSAVRGGEK